MRPLPPLTMQEARSIAADVWRRRHRECPEDVLEAALAIRSEAGPAYTNPLWLTTAMELNLLDSTDFGKPKRTTAARRPAACAHSEDGAGSSGGGGRTLRCGDRAVNGPMAWSSAGVSRAAGSRKARLAGERCGSSRQRRRPVRGGLRPREWAPVRQAALRRGFRMHVTTAGGLWNFRALARCTVRRSVGRFAMPGRRARSTS